MRGFITDRTKADVDRCKELAAKGWNNMTEAEKAEWYGAAMRGAYNYSDLNRVESAVAELSEFLALGLATKTDWGMWDAPTQADMSRYISNLKAVKESFLSGVSVPDTMDGFTYGSANNIEKMLAEAFGKMDASEAWEKKPATVEYDWLYTRDENHESIGKTGTDRQWSFYGGMIRATKELAFDTRAGFNDRVQDIGLIESKGCYIITGDKCEARQISNAVHTGNTDDNGGNGTLYEIQYSYTVVGYATRVWSAYCSASDKTLGRVLVPKGELPSGTLIKGSYAEGYCCVQEADGKYYYYELR